MPQEDNPADKGKGLRTQKKGGKPGAGRGQSKGKKMSLLGPTVLARGELIRSLGFCCKDRELTCAHIQTELIIACMYKGLIVGSDMLLGGIKKCPLYTPLQASLKGAS